MFPFYGLQIEKEGILRAHQTLSDADLMLLLVDATIYHTWVEEKSSSNTFTDYLRKYVQQLKLEDSILNCRNIQQMLNCHQVSTNYTSVCLVVFNKLDLIEDLRHINNICIQYPESVTGISCKNSEHLESLIEKMKIHLESL